MQNLHQKYPAVFKLLAEEVSPTQVVSDELMKFFETAGITEADLPLMEQALNSHPQYKEGLPFPGDDDVYDLLVKNNLGFALLQKFFDYWG